MKNIQHKIEYFSFKLLYFILKILPLKFSFFVGENIGSIIYFLRIRYKVSLANMNLLYGNKLSKSKKEKIIHKSYRNFTLSAVEYILLPRMKNRLKDMVILDNKSELDSALDTGAILVTGHYGSWEILGAALREYGYPVDFLVGEQRNLYIDKFMNDIRHTMGIGTIKIGIGARAVLKALKEKKYIAMLSDQDSGNSGVNINFFGVLASTHKGPSAFAITAGVPILTGAIIRTKNKCSHHLKIYKINPTNSGSRDEDIKNLTQQYSSILEQIIRENPEGWFWAHKRFKSTIGEIYK